MAAAFSAISCLCKAASRPFFSAGEHTAPKPPPACPGAGKQLIRRRINSRCSAQSELMRHGCRLVPAAEVPEQCTIMLAQLAVPRLDLHAQPRSSHCTTQVIDPALALAAACLQQPRPCRGRRRLTWPCCCECARAGRSVIACRTLMATLLSPDDCSAASDCLSHSGKPVGQGNGHGSLVLGAKVQYAKQSKLRVCCGAAGTGDLQDSRHCCA